MKDLYPIGSQWKLLASTCIPQSVGKIYTLKRKSNQVFLSKSGDISWNTRVTPKGTNFLTTEEWECVSKAGIWERHYASKKYTNNPCGEITLTPPTVRPPKLTKPCDCSARDLLWNGHKCKAYASNKVKF